MSKVISLNYELKDTKNGEILESNLESNALYFITGKGHILPALENEVIKLSIGEEKNIILNKNEGVGEYDNNLLQNIPIEQFAGIELKEGMELFGENEEGETARVIVKEIKDDEVIVDFNHPYAGRDLDFFVKIVDIRDANENEELTGVVDVPHVCGCGDHHDDECCGGHHHKDHECCGRHKH